MKTTKICPLPWHHFYFNSSGRIKACCTADKSVAPISEDKKSVTEFINENRNHPHLVEVRESWMRGEVPQTCQKCVTYSNGKKVDGVITELKHLEPLNTSKVDYPARHIDYRFDKTCQANCIMCVPGDSSRWESIVKNQPKFEKWLKRGGNIDFEIDYKWLYEADEIVYLNIAGGEPLLTDRKYDFLHDNMHKIKRLRFISNIHNINESVYKLIEQYSDKIKMTISCDGLYDVYEFHRAGLKWSQFEKNYKRLLTLLPKSKMSINMVLTRYNEHQQEEFKKYFEGHDIDISWAHQADHIYDPEFVDLYKNTINVS